MKKVLIAKESWESSRDGGQIFYRLESITVNDHEKFIEMIKELNYVPLLVGEYTECTTLVPTGGYDYDGGAFYHTIAYTKDKTAEDFINYYLEGEKEYGDCFKEEADIVRKYIGLK